MTAKKKTVKKTVTKKAITPVVFKAGLKTALITRIWPKIYLAVSLAVLAGTSTLWSLLGAKLQQANADQLVNPYLFENTSTFHNADFPGAHSFLIKWPLFFLIKLFGYSSSVFIAVTILAVLATVGALLFVLYRIERRPLVLGTLCLALASVLLLVPAQPYAGGLLPVNMAMLATRNLEYVIYMAAAAFFVRAGGWRNWRFWLSVVLLGLLIASDKLFLDISITTALFALVVYSLRRNWEFVNLSSSWLTAILVSAVTGISLLGFINATSLTHISSGNNPYAFVSNGKDLVIGGLYSIMGLATNFGANPAYDATIVRHIPHQFFSRLLSISGPVYVLNFMILVFGLFSAYWLIKSSLAKKKSRLALDKFTGLGVVMVWSTLAAFVLFIISSHYYAVDSRYLTISLFSLFISVALRTRNRNWPQKHIVLAGIVISVGIIFGTITNVRTFNTQSSALADMSKRNSSVAQALKAHPVDILVGDYWRVLPIRAASGSTLKVDPLSSCATPRDLLSSRSWQPNLNTHSFGYLLSLDRSQSDYPRCSVTQALANYGRPNSSILIAGSFKKPKELLLLYDHGIHFAPAKGAGLTKVPGTVLPLDLADLPNSSCTTPTVLNIVAHQDDDLLFMNPDLSASIKKGDCVRTIYITAGDSGFDQYYWLGREQGSEAAYSHMLGRDEIWIDRVVKITDKQYVTIASPRGNSSVSLIFVHLPDGGLKGSGFGANANESLEKLISGQIKTMHAIDRQSTYTAADLTSLLASLMHVYQPAEIRTQANYSGSRFTDHSDHMAVGRFVKQAYANYEKQQFEDQVTIPIKFYIGYPVHEMPQNIFDGQLQEKQAVFLDYAKHDIGVCQTLEQCGQTLTYANYLSREYQNPD